MADPVTLTVGAALIGAGATLVSAAAGGTIAAANLAYNIHKDRKSAKGNGDKEVCNPLLEKSCQNNGNNAAPSSC